MASTIDKRGRNLRAAYYLAGLAALAPAPIVAETCDQLSGETIRWIVPYSAGGGYDTYSRLIEPVLERYLDAEIAIVNMPGAGGLVGVKSIMSQEPDGKTIGFINASGLLVARLGAQEDIPSLSEDLTVLGRVARDQSVWLVNRESDIHVDADGAFVGASGPLLFGVTGIGSGDWFTVTIAASLLDLQKEFIAGYDGSKEASLGLVRGEFDTMDVSWGSAIAPIENGELKPILQISSAPTADHASLEGVPVLGGPDGAARRRAAATGGDAEATGALADALVEVLGAGRTVVAPAGLPDDIHACLEERVYQAINDPEFLDAAEKARRPLDIARGRDAASAILSAEQYLSDLRSIVESEK
ncbi:tripartite tricarboxylate transporter substrate-binding protein [Tropicimonas marinistellae]|uniref:tripartite tricarboxylate transporter substrate-binding protein n=1 Tax=Tropicimonas marinistellae TaxID=1739787 RepID=UPI00082D3DA7|nr:tripartite tricarboxylate transporter substrate-binding protein [Tropicimonas marinistellae]